MCRGQSMKTLKRPHARWECFLVMSLLRHRPILLVIRMVDPSYFREEWAAREDENPGEQARGRAWRELYCYSPLSHFDCWSVKTLIDCSDPGPNPNPNPLTLTPGNLKEQKRRVDTATLMLLHLPSLPNSIHLCTVYGRMIAVTALLWVIHKSPTFNFLQLGLTVSYFLLVSRNTKLYETCHCFAVSIISRNLTKIR